MKQDKKSDDVKMTIRMPKKYHDEIKYVADENGNNFVDTLLFLSRMGFKFYTADFHAHLNADEKETI